MNEELNENEVKTINIFPCKSSRRILTFLADFFICFIASIFLFEVLVKPISFAIIKFNEITNKSNEAAVNNVRILYDNKLLYFEEVNEGNITKSIKDTCDKFTQDFCFKLDEKEHDVFSRYFVNFKNTNTDELLEKYDKEASEYFIVDKENKTVEMKEEYINLFSPKFDSKNDLSEVGSKKYDKYQEDFFLKFYVEIIIQDALENDLVCEAHPEYGSYKSNHNYYLEYEKQIQLVNKIDASITFAIVMIIFYFIVPLTNKKGQTCSEMIMKIEHIDIKNLKYLKKRFVVTEGIMNVLTNSVMLFLIPFVSYGIGPVFALTELISISAIGLLFVIIQLILLLATKMNQTLKELSTHSICVDSSTMDEYYKEKGYDF